MISPKSSPAATSTISDFSFRFFSSSLSSLAWSSVGFPRKRAEMKMCTVSGNVTVKEKGGQVSRRHHRATSILHSITLD